jgi:hypothetical protein
MKRSALVGAALFAAVAAIFAVGITTASAAPKLHFSPVFVSIADGSAVEGQMGALKLSVVKPLAPQAGLPNTHIYWKTISGGTGMLGTDYASQTGLKTLVPGQVTADVVVGGLDDNIYQLSHTFKVQIWSDDPWVIFTRNTATFTMLDNDTKPTAYIGDQSPSWVYEGGDLTWTVSLSNPSYQPVTVSLDGGNNIWTTLLPADYDGTMPTSVTIPPYASSTSFTIHTHDEITQTYKVMWIWMTGVTNGSMPAYDYGNSADQLDCWGYGTVWDEGY